MSTLKFIKTGDGVTVIEKNFCGTIEKIGNVITDSNFAKSSFSPNSWFTFSSDELLEIAHHMHTLEIKHHAHE
jgi:hypothetical protein